jgi:iron complex transport system permease protein
MGRLRLATKRWLSRSAANSSTAPISAALTSGTCAEVVSQRFVANLNLPIGLTTGLLGGVYLLWLLARNRRA